jgi:hypothetical protein
MLARWRLPLLASARLLFTKNDCFSCGRLPLLVRNDCFSCGRLPLLARLARNDRFSREPLVDLPLLVDVRPRGVDARPLRFRHASADALDRLVGHDSRVRSELRANRLGWLAQLTQPAQQRAATRRPLGTRAAGVLFALPAPAFVGGARRAQLAHQPPLTPSPEEDLGLLSSQQSAPAHVARDVGMGGHDRSGGHRGATG